MMGDIPWRSWARANVCCSDDSPAVYKFLGIDHSRTIYEWLTLVKE